MYKVLLRSKNTGSPFTYIFTSALFLAFHYFLVTYINSTFLGSVISNKLVGIIYAAGAIINICILFMMPKIIAKTSNYATILTLSILEVIFLSTFIFIKEPWIIITAFIFHHAITPLLLMCLDITIEDSAQKNNIGKLRGIFLTILSIAAVISPLIVGSLMVADGFNHIYAFSIFFMVLFFLTVWFNFKKTPNGVYKTISSKQEIKEFWKNKNVRTIGFCNILMELFFCWMIIYIPLYLSQVIGFAWGDIGLIISIALLPFLILEIPIGELADKILGEKELLVLGFSIMAVSLFIIPLLKEADFTSWALILLFSRIGASIVNISSESYFFKKVKGKDELISIFRMSGPIAFIIGPIIGTVSLFLLPFGWIFPVLGVFMILGITTAFKLKDTL